MTDVTVRFPRELAALVQDALLNQAAAHSRDAHAMPAGSDGQRRTAEHASSVYQAARLVTLARANQDQDSGISPLTRSVA